MKYFRIFGSKCSILKDRESLRKFDTRSDEGIFLGYSTSSRAYKVFNNQTKTVMESCNVTVDDKVNDKKVEIEFRTQKQVKNVATEALKESTTISDTSSPIQTTTSNFSSSPMISSSQVSSPGPPSPLLVQPSPS